MKKYTILLFLFICFDKIVAQDCPQGYEERTVKCNGRFEKKCIPANYSCNQCWAVSTVSCPGVKLPGLAHYSSYEKAFAVAEADKNTALSTTNYKCSGNDPRKYTIYLDDSKSCNDGSSAVSNDLKNKILAFLKRYQAEIKNYKRYFSGQPYKPGAVTKEYQSVLKKAEENANSLSLKLNSLTDENLSQFESEFENIKDDENRLMNADLAYKNSITNYNLPNTKPSVKNYSNTNNTPSTSNNQNATDDQYNSIMNDYNRKKENSQKTFDILSNGVQDIFNTLQQSQAKKRDNEQKIQEERRKQIEKQRQLEDQYRQRKEEEQLEKDKREAEALAEIQRNQFLIASKNDFISELQNQTFKTAYSNSERTAVIFWYPKIITADIQPFYISNLIIIKSYADGSFPLKEKLYELSKRYLTPTLLNDLDLTYMLIYPLKEDAGLAAKLISLPQICENINLQYHTVQIEEIGAIQKEDKTQTDFWGNPVKKATKSTQPVKQTKKIKSTNNDFWNN